MNNWKNCPKCRCMNLDRENCVDCGRDLSDVVAEQPKAVCSSGDADPYQRIFGISSVTQTRVSAKPLAVVTKQGGPILKEGFIRAAGENVVAIEIDMKSKRCSVIIESATEDGAPVIWLDGTNALHLKKGHENEETEVTFPDYKDWRIFSAEICRYTFRVCLVRDAGRPNY